MTPSDAPREVPFSGRAPLFPLPDSTLFPNVMLPLHIFEPRYQCMVEDSLASDSFIAMAVLKRGFETVYETRTCPIHNVVCLGRIIADERLDDGRYYLLMQGVCRARVLREEDTDLPYRTATLDIIEDLYPHVPVINRAHRREELLCGFQQMFPKLGLDASLLNALQEGVPLGELCDVIAHAMRLQPEHALRLLEQADVDQRSDLVLELLKLQCRLNAGHDRLYPPDFSLN